MTEIDIQANVNEEEKKIVLSGVNSDDFVINYSSDVDFTPLVELLTKKVDDGNKFILNINAYDSEEKVDLIIGTLEEIFNAYNQSLIEHFGEEEEEEEF